MANLSKEQQWYNALRQAYNARLRSWMRDFIVQQFIYFFCLTGYHYTDPEVLSEIKRMVEAWDGAFREDAASEGPPFPMPSLTVVRRQEPVPGAPQPSGITTAANQYGDAIKNVFEFHPAEQTDDEKEALAIARMEVMQHLHTIELSEANTSTLAENTGDDLDDAGCSENGDDQAEPGNEMEFLSELADDLEI